MRSFRAAYLLPSHGRPLSTIYKDVRWQSLCPRRHCSSCAPPHPPPTLNPTTKDPPTPPADHRILAVEQDLFTTSPYSPGSPLLLPNGARIFNKLLSFLRAQYNLFGFQEVITPTIYKKSLWEKSGHWENYKDDMFEVRGRGASGQAKDAEIGEDEEYGLKPMNCPGHCLLFKAQKRSFRDLPIRFADFSPLHRNEISGALSGLTRVRRFHQDDGHIFCRPSQIAEEISRTLDFVALVYKTFNLGPYKLLLSTRPADHYIGTIEEWDRAEDQLKTALDNSGRQWAINAGDGAFYGPKIDIILKDSDGKEHQTATIQLDFQLPQRFELEYQAPAPELEQKGLHTDDAALLDKSGPVTPVIVHRAILGSLERFMALLIEHYNGRWPFWLSPRQAIIVTVGRGGDLQQYVQQAQQTISGVTTATADSPMQLDVPTFAVDIDDSDRALGKKISEAKRKKYAVVIVVGNKSAENGTVELDLRGQRDQEATREVLGDLLAADALGDGRSVKMTPEQVYEYFCGLGERFA
ncbi:MAG: hypothetical protein M1819_000744 [Sarea resinae]|nr:MAG: hypothetical protein M1819_000744 [Sarea resinae]